MKKILFVGAEAVPFASTGGLGDVISSLPAALCRAGEDARVVLPLYRAVGEEWRGQMQKVAEFEVSLAWRRLYCGVHMLQREGVSYYFIDNEYYFGREGLYGHFDDGERYAFFCMAALAMLPHVDFFPDVLHAHDWQGALAVIYLRTLFAQNGEYRGIRSVFTIHNIEYQGRFPADILGDVFALGEDTRESLDFAGGINLMKGAILYADRVTTVSPRYAEEICTPAFGWGLDAVLRENAYKLEGIVNGIDYKRYDPAKDREIARQFTARSVSRKAENKLALQRELGLPERADVPMLCVVSRLAAHKGMDLITGAAQALLQEDVQLLVLGCGDARLEDLFRTMERENPHRVRAYIGYDRALASRIYAACDIFLMPSASEPCGLSQMIASRYGALPVVHTVGGLFDTVKPYEKTQNGITGNGFCFSEYSVGAFLGAVSEALSIWRDVAQREKLVAHVMRTDFSWTRSAAVYHRLYALI
jgi:starch synthase